MASGAIYTIMISFMEWVRANEISHSGELAGLGGGRPFRGASSLAPDLRATKVFGFVASPSLLSSIRRYGAAAGGLPPAVEAVLDDIDDDVAMLSNGELEAFRRLASDMRAAGGFASIAGEELGRALSGAVSAALDEFPPKRDT